MTTAALRVRFPRDDGFRADLEARVAGYFARTGRSPFGGRALRVKTAAIFAWFAASYAPLLAFGGDSAWLAAGLTLSLALATAGIGFSVMHDANHGAYSRSPAASSPKLVTLPPGRSACQSRWSVAWPAAHEHRGRPDVPVDDGLAVAVGQRAPDG